MPLWASQSPRWSPPTAVSRSRKFLSLRCRSRRRCHHHRRDRPKLPPLGIHVCPYLQSPPSLSPFGPRTGILTFPAFNLSLLSPFGFRFIMSTIKYILRIHLMYIFT